MNVKARGHGVSPCVGCGFFHFVLWFSSRLMEKLLFQLSIYALSLEAFLSMSIWTFLSSCHEL